MAFDNVAKSASMSGVGPAQQHIADLMSEAWLAFARSGNPAHTGLPDWPAYDAQTRMVMMFDTEPRVKSDPHGAQRSLLLEKPL
jgi:para-nitrobenzyl esterase